MKFKNSICLVFFIILVSSCKLWKLEDKKAQHDYYYFIDTSSYSNSKDSIAALIKTNSGGYAVAGTNFDDDDTTIFIDTLDEFGNENKIQFPLDDPVICADVIQTSGNFILLCSHKKILKEIDNKTLYIKLSLVSVDLNLSNKLVTDLKIYSDAYQANGLCKNNSTDGFFITIAENHTDSMVTGYNYFTDFNSVDFTKSFLQVKRLDLNDNKEIANRTVRVIPASDGFLSLTQSIRKDSKYCSIYLIKYNIRDNLPVQSTPEPIDKDAYNISNSLVINRNGDTVYAIAKSDKSFSLIINNSSKFKVFNNVPVKYSLSIIKTHEGLAILASGSENEPMSLITTDNEGNQINKKTYDRFFTVTNRSIVLADDNGFFIAAYYRNKDNKAILAFLKTGNDGSYE